MLTTSSDIHEKGRVAKAAGKESAPEADLGQGVNATTGRIRVKIDKKDGSKRTDGATAMTGGREHGVIGHGASSAGSETHGMRIDEVMAIGRRSNRCASSTTLREVGIASLKIQSQAIGSVAHPMSVLSLLSLSCSEAGQGADLYRNLVM